MTTTASNSSTSTIPTETCTTTKNSINSSNCNSIGNSNNTKGNLHSLLKAYDHTLTQDNASQGVGVGVIETNLNINSSHPLGGSSADSISLQLDHLGRERSSTLGSIRDRGLTFGSEFDLGLGLTSDTISDDAGVFDLSVVSNQKVNVISAGNSNVSGGNIGVGVGGITFHVHANNNTSIGNNQLNHIKMEQHHYHSEEQPTIQKNHFGTAASAAPQDYPRGNEQTNTSETNDNNISNNTAGYLSKMFSSELEGGHQHDHEHKHRYHEFGHGQPSQQPQQQQTNKALGHTPPSAAATSYEMKHFGKRVRSGSLSGRLRSMSDLEDKGIIDSNQKGILKDLIISGDDELMLAVEKYEKGDSKALESMIKSGALRKRHASDIDILGDLDLDFLSMNEDFIGGAGSVSGGEEGSHGGGGGGGNCHSHPINSKSLPIPIRTRRRSLSEISNAFVQPSNTDSDASHSMREPSPAPVHSGSYDGIGDLDFNADYAAQSGHNNHQHQIMTSKPRSDSIIDLPRNRANSLAFGDLLDAAAKTTSTVPMTTKPRSDSIFDLQRNRANSLAFGGLLDEATSEEVESVGKWMDRAPIMQEGRNVPLKKRLPSQSQIVGANGGLYIINSNNNQTSSMQRSGNGCENDTSKNKLPTESLTPAEIRRRDREIKKAIKEREKMERKMQRERDKLEKKEREAKEKKSSKKKKGEYTKKKKADICGEDGDNDEPKVILSGTGRPRSLSDPNLSISLDANGLMQIEHPPDWVGAYSPQSRKIRIDRFLAKRNHRVWVKKVKYDVRKNFADSRLRVKGRFVKKEDELLMRDLMSLT